MKLIKSMSWKWSALVWLNFHIMVTSLICLFEFSYYNVMFKYVHDKLGVKVCNLLCSSGFTAFFCLDALTYAAYLYKRPSLILFWSTPFQQYLSIGPIFACLIFKSLHRFQMNVTLR